MVGTSVRSAEEGSVEFPPALALPLPEQEAKASVIEIKLQNNNLFILSDLSVSSDLHNILS